MRDPERSTYGCIQAQVKLREMRLNKYYDWHMREHGKHMPFAPVTYQRVGLDEFHRDERRSDLVHALKHQDVLAGTVDDAHDKLCTGCLQFQAILHAYRDLVKKAVQNARMNHGVREMRDRRMEAGAVRRQVFFNDGLFLVVEFNTNNLSQHQGHVVTLYRKS